MVVRWNAYVDYVVLVENYNLTFINVLVNLHRNVSRIWDVSLVLDYGAMT